MYEVIAQRIEKAGADRTYLTMIEAGALASRKTSPGSPGPADPARRTQPARRPMSTTFGYLVRALAYALDGATAP